MRTLIGRFVILSLSLAASWAPWSTAGAAAGQAAPKTPTPPSSPTSPAAIVAGLMRADYEGDRVALKRLREEITVPSDDPAKAARLLYWRGFSLWRSVINGVNDAVDNKILAQEAKDALAEFEKAIAADPGFADAAVGKLACMQLVGFLSRSGGGTATEEFKNLYARFLALLSETEKVAPENPRLLWIKGMQESFTMPTMPPEQIEKRLRTGLATYERGLQLAREQKTKARDPLDPVWGEPEMLMSLAHVYLNQPKPDTATAERYAKEALALVPYWHYVRDILVPQIEKAKQGATDKKPDEKKPDATEKKPE